LKASSLENVTRHNSILILGRTTSFVIQPVEADNFLWFFVPSPKGVVLEPTTARVVDRQASSSAARIENLIDSTYAFYALRTRRKDVKGGSGSAG
jgi:hypothetical protein